MLFLSKETSYYEPMFTLVSYFQLNLFRNTFFFNVSQKYFAFCFSNFILHFEFQHLQWKSDDFNIFGEKTAGLTTQFFWAYNTYNKRYYFKTINVTFHVKPFLFYRQSLK